jgi:hypothetical protein
LYVAYRYMCVHIIPASHKLIWQLIGYRSIWVPGAHSNVEVLPLAVEVVLAERVSAVAAVAAVAAALAAVSCSTSSSGTTCSMQHHK